MALEDRQRLTALGRVAGPDEHPRDSNPWPCADDDQPPGRLQACEGVYPHPPSDREAVRTEGGRFVLLVHHRGIIAEEASASNASANAS